LSPAAVDDRIVGELPSGIEGFKLKRQHLPGVIDLFEVSEAAEIEAVARDTRLDRKFDSSGCPVNWLLLKRSLAVLSFAGRRFPTMIARDDNERARRQNELWNRLSERAAAIKDGAEELRPLAEWVRGAGADEEVGILVQQLLGQLFSSDFVATEESWEAAKVLVAAPRSKNIPQVAWWFLSGKLARAKRILAGMVNGDLSAVNAIGIAAHNVVKSIRQMRVLYANTATRGSLMAETAAEKCLFAPVRLYRQATTAGEFGDCPFSKGSLFVLAIGEASRQPGGRSLVFMDDTWSQCPANVWVPAMLQGVWKRACA
jgi:hypothetical protein